MWPFKSAPRKTSKRSYAGAVFNRLVAGWITASTSMDAEVKSSLRNLRNRSRQLGRDNDYVKGFFREVQNNIVGEGIPFQAQVKMKRGIKLDDGINSEIEDAWTEWANKSSCHTAGVLAFQDIERLAIRSTAESGEIFVRMIRQKFGNSKIPFALEIIEADLLDELELAQSATGNEVRMGVEVDKWMRPVAYWFRQRHPGDYPFINGGAPGTDRIRIPAEEIIPLQIIERPVQTRSVPWLASAIMRLHQVGGYEEAEVIAARAAASLMGFVESPEGEIQSDGVEDGEKITDFQPGVFKYLGPGEKVSIPDMHRPSGQFEPFMRIMLRGVAAAAGVSYSTMSRDYSQSNFSSSRMDMLSERDNWRILQKWMIRNFHQTFMKIGSTWLFCPAPSISPAMN
jgi:lambda family phage portal protein